MAEAIHHGQKQLDGERPNEAASNCKNEEPRERTVSNRHQIAERGGDAGRSGIHGSSSNDSNATTPRPEQAKQSQTCPRLSVQRPVDSQTAQDSITTSSGMTYCAGLTAGNSLMTPPPVGTGNGRLRVF